MRTPTKREKKIARLQTTLVACQLIGIAGVVIFLFSVMGMTFYYI